MSANGRWQQRRNRCSTGSPAERRHPTVLETRTVARTVRERREGIPSHFGSRPANAYLEGQTLTRSVKRVARGLRNEEYLATAIFPGLGGYRSTPSLALHPSPCYPPETPKSHKKGTYAPQYDSHSRRMSGVFPHQAHARGDIGDEPRAVARHGTRGARRV